MLSGRGVEPDRIRELAEASIPAAEAFVDQNRSAYKLEDKARGSLNRSRATAVDLIGWAYYLKKELPTAEAGLGEAERLARGQDLVNQFHLGELARAKGESERAAQYHLNALTLGSGPEPVRRAAQKALADLHGEDGFDAYLQGELARRRDLRREEAIRSMVDLPAPAIPLTDLEGKALDVAALRGKVLLLNFFASW